MKKKFLALSIFATAFAAALTAGCNTAQGQNSSDNGPKDSYSVAFKSGVGFTYEGLTYDENAWQTVTVEEGETITFTLDIGAFYTGTPTVVAGETAIPSQDGVYSLTVTEDTTVTVNGIVKDVSAMAGSGAFDDAYVVTRPIDLLYIADRVNAGDPEYTQAAYVLANDIDCKGEALKVIGDLRNDQAFFSGCFTCYTNSETGEMIRYTISNFTIDTTDKNYVGLFGCVQTDPSVTSSGLFYGICLDNFTINANASQLPEDNATIYCGSLVGYGVGVTAYLCDSTNGQINVQADDNYFSFVGGLMGCVQGRYATEYATAYATEIAYATVDVDVACVQGTALYAGGVVSYAFTDNVTAPSLIHNVYSTGNVSGAIRSGGIAGGLGQYTSISSVYASGNVSAKSTQRKEVVSDESYCYAYAGGLVGYGENDCIASDSFSSGVVYATSVSGKNYQKTGGIFGGGDASATVSVNSEKFTEFNCLSGVTKDTAKTAMETLGWREHDWTIADGEFPVINYETYEGNIATTITIKYVGLDGKATKVNGSTEDTFIYDDIYAPVIDAFESQEMSIYLKDDNGNLSFGYFFDEACTIPMPYTFLTTRDVTVYVGFADPTAVLGSYELATDAGKISFTLKNDGTLEYYDGTIKQVANYQYNGKTVLLESVLFAKYYTGIVDAEQSVNADAAFDLNRYNYTNLYAEKNGDTLTLYDGKYFTKTAPLTAYVSGKTPTVHGTYYKQEQGVLHYYEFRLDGTGEYTMDDMPYSFTYKKSGAKYILTFADKSTEEVTLSELTALDSFKGTWTKAFTVGKVYTFDGMGTWTYRYGKSFTSGSYTVDGETLTMDNGKTAMFSDGFLSINGETYYPELGYVGTWKTTDGNVVLELFGIQTDGDGEAKVTYESGLFYDLVYERSMTENYVCLYLLQDSGSKTIGDYKVIFGYLYNDGYGMQATLYDPNSYDVTNTESSGYGIFTLNAVDCYAGEWISTDELFGEITFNDNGTLTIKGVTQAYTRKNNTLEISFTYNGVQYSATLDEENNIISLGEITLERKDEFAGIDFIAFNDKNFSVNGAFSFDGKGNLENGGMMKATVNGTETNYIYKATATGYEILQEGNAVGSILPSADGSHYKVTINEQTSLLYVKNDLMGKWAMGGQFGLFEIGPTDLDGMIIAKYMSVNVKMEVVSNTQLTFSCRIENMPRTFYLFLFGENNDCLAITEYTSLSYNDYTVCSKVDTFYGTWTYQANKDITLTFDGVSFDKDNRYSYGTAHLSYKGFPTAYNYIVYEDGTAMIWSQATLGGYTKYYKWIACEKNDPEAFLNGDKAFKRVEIDSLYRTEAKDENDVTYTFNGGNVGDTLGEVTASNGKTYSYKIKEYKNNIATLAMTDKQTNKTYTATLDYSNANEITIKLTENAD